MPTNRITMRRIRETLRLHLQAELSYNEVGRALKISKSAVGKYVSLARRSPRGIWSAKQSSICGNHRSRRSNITRQSQRLQYALKDTARAYGFAQVDVIDVDLGMSACSGAQVREGFKQLLASVALGEVGIVLSREPSRLSRTDKDWCHLMELCRVLDRGACS